MLTAGAGGSHYLRGIDLITTKIIKSPAKLIKLSYATLIK